MKADIKRWNRIYQNKGFSYTSSLSYWPNLIEFFKDSRVNKVLDIGCGSGSHMLDLVEEGFDVSGLDSSSEAVKLAQKRFSQKEFSGCLKNCSMHQRLPFLDNYFDAVISLRTLNHGHIEEIKETTKEMARVVKKGGYCFINSLFIPGRKKWKGETSLNTLKVKMVAPRTYVPLEGGEKGVIHFLFNKKILLNLFKEDFQTLKFWIDYGTKKWERYYCLLCRRE